MNRLELFRCKTLDGARLTRGGCAAKYSDAKANRDAVPGTETHGRTHRCRGCTVGEAHARGESAQAWADGSPVELAALGATPPTAPRRDAPEPITTSEENEMGSKVTMLTHDGITDSIDGWAKRLDLTPEALYMRMKKTDDVAKILAPRQAAKPGTSSSRSARASKTPAKPSKPARQRPPIARSAGGEARAERVESPAEAVRAALTSLGPVELLQRLGYAVEDLGPTPAGRVFVVREAGAE